MPIDLRAAAGDWAAILHQLQPSFRPRAPELGLIAAVGESRIGDKHEYLLAKLFQPEPGDIAESSEGFLRFSSRYIRRAHAYMRDHRLAGILMLHTHPLSDLQVGFSWFDDEQEPLLVQNLMEIDPSTQLLSVVLGKSSQCGRRWLDDRSPEDLGDLVLVGDELKWLSLAGRPVPDPASPSAIFDSALAVTGAGALAQLTRMKVGVVGASGTGSIVVELLLRAGCKNIVLIDHDTVEDRNLNRILHALRADSQQNLDKVMVAQRNVDAVQFDCRIEAIKDTILDNEVLAQLRSVDIVFGCVDAAYPRLLLSKFAYQYLRPYIDVGSEIGGDDHGIVSVDARTSYVAPGRPCLRCCGLTPPRQLTFESLAHEERQRVVGLGYSDDLLLKQPSTMDLNMRSASYGMMFLRHLLQPFLMPPFPLAVQENLVTYATRPIMSAREADERCNICHMNPSFGFGDRGPTIGLARDTVDAILGRKSRGSLNP